MPTQGACQPASTAECDPFCRGGLTDLTLTWPNLKTIGVNRRLSFPHHRVDALHCPSSVECFRLETAEATCWVVVLRASYALPRLPSSAVCGWLHAAVISLRVPSPVRWRGRLALASWHPGISRQIGLFEFYTTAQLAVATKGAAFRPL